MRFSRNRGSMLSLVAVMTSILVAFGMGMLFLLADFRCVRNTHHVVESCALNVACKAPGIEYQLEGAPEIQFYRDVSDNGKISLKNVNRVYGKAMLVAINAAAAGSYAGNGASNALLAAQGAREIDDRMQEILSRHSMLPSFTDIAKKYSNGAVKPDSSEHWQSARGDAGMESNLELADNLPFMSGSGPVGLQNYKLSDSYIKTAGLGPFQGSGRFVKGYTPIVVGTSKFFLVPFKRGEQPHLISPSTFHDAQVSDGGKLDGPPNMFAVPGFSTDAAGNALKATAYAEASVQQTYPMQIPHAFLRLHVRNRLEWYGSPQEQQPRLVQDYGFAPDWAFFPGLIFIDGIPWFGIAATGGEYSPRATFENSMFPDGSWSAAGTGGKAAKVLLQRVKEMNPSITEKQFLDCLQSGLISVPGSSDEILIYPGEHGLLFSSDQPWAPQFPNDCQRSAQAEGSDEVLAEENQQVDNGGWYWMPWATFLPRTAKSAIAIKQTWRAGTGYTGCLGELDVVHTTRAYWSNQPSFWIGWIPW